MHEEERKLCLIWAEAELVLTQATIKDYQGQDLKAKNHFDVKIAIFYSLGDTYTAQNNIKKSPSLEWQHLHPWSSRIYTTISLLIQVCTPKINFRAHKYFVSGWVSNDTIYPVPSVEI